MKRPINYRQFEAFRAVMICGSITAGSRFLNISQPAVTRLIRDLEFDTGLRLFQRDKGRALPTHAARQLFREVERHFAGADRLREAVEAIRRGDSVALRIAAMPSLSSSCIPKAVERFLVDYPKSTLHIHSANSAEVANLIRKGMFDVGFGVMEPVVNDLHRVEFPPYEAVCLLPTGHPLADQKEIVAQDLDGYDFISLSSNSMMRSRINAAIELSGALPSMRLETVYSAAVVSYVRQGLGVAITDPLSVSSSAEARQIVVRPFRPALRFNITAIYKDQDQVLEAAGCFSDHLCDVLGEEVQHVAELMTDSISH